MSYQLRENCPYSEFSWSEFSHIRTDYGEIRSIQCECGKMRTRKTPNTDTFYAVINKEAYLKPCQTSMMHYFCKNS